MKIYISGKISGLPLDEVRAKFEWAAYQIKSFGHEAMNPLNNGLDPSEHWNKHMIADIALLLECDAIFLLPDWMNSRGARIELNIAQECGKPILFRPLF